MPTYFDEDDIHDTGFIDLIKLALLKLSHHCTCRAYREANLGRGLLSLLQYVRGPRAYRQERTGE